ncbi:MAG: potassium channel family protein [Saccharofermentanales bacterium]|jgi:trk system potassium uptake protein TrkA|nr:TrkA family potassium uptake protein [Bacillota bacterium]NLB08822.1 TrkA family potassium uptake protein [Clostridiales bacterium]
MQVLIIGAGKLGRELATALLDRDDQVILVDIKPESLRLAEQIPCVKILGDMTDKEVLRRAQIETADVVCCVADSDNINIMATWVATRIFAVPRVLTRMYNPQKEDVFQALGMQTISSTQFTVSAFLRSLDDEETVMRHRLFDSTVTYSLVDLPAELVGSKIADVQSASGQIIFGVRRQNRTLPLSAELTLKAGDQIIMAELN